MARLAKLRHNFNISPKILDYRVDYGIKKLLEIIQAAKNGITVSELLLRLPGYPRRTAQRHLAKLVERGEIIAVGDGRARHYCIRKTAPKDTNVFQYEEILPETIPLSEDSKDILKYIEQPLEARHPVGYQHDFLNSYIPNKTRYLSEPLCRQLHKMGKTTDIEQPAGTYSRAILNRLLIDLSWASSHLEGNTYSRLDTRELIDHGKAASGKAAIETQMILNHKSAIELLVENIIDIDLNRFMIMNLHSTLAENLLQNPSDEGRVRQHVVEISKSVYRPLSVASQIESELALLLQKVNQINDPFEQSFFMMAHLPYLQPFADINKRTSRLAANLPLFRENLCPLTFLDVSEKAYSCAMLGIYEMTRVELLRDLYVWAYERSTQEYLVIQQELAEPDPLRLAWRDLIKQSIRDVVLNPDEEPMSIIEQAVSDIVVVDEKEAVIALIIEELRRLHEGVLARYGLRPSEYYKWLNQQ